MATPENVKEKEMREIQEILKNAKDALESEKILADHEAIKRGLNSKGISLLEVKNRLMMQYMHDLTVILVTKLSRQSIKDHPAIWRLIQNRSYMEKTMGIEQKLKYEINKLVKKHRFGDSGEPDGLKFKPQMDNFNVQSDDDDDEDEEEEEDKDDSENEDEDEEDKKTQLKGVYRPPRVAPMPYTGDETVEEKKKRAKKRVLSNALLADLRAELLDEPEDIAENPDLHRIRADKQRKEREEYEEKYFVRTSVSKKEKDKRRQMATMSSLEGLAKFDDYNLLSDYFGDEAAEGPTAKKKMKSSKGFKGKFKKGKGKKKRHH